MRGIARTAWLLLCWGRLQRWLLGIGLTVIAAGLAALYTGWRSDLQPLFGLLVIIGIGCAVISAALIDGLLFRSLSASRATSLIPGGRLKLVAGAFSAQLLAAAFIGITWGLMAAAPGSSGIHAKGVLVFLGAFTVLSVQFVGYFWFSKFRFGGVWFACLAIAPQQFISAVHRWNLADRISGLSGAAVVLGLLMLGWVLFAYLFIHARQIRMPRLFSALYQMSGANQPAGALLLAQAVAEPAVYSRRAALRTLLLGLSRGGRLAQFLVWSGFLLLFVAMPRYFKGAAGAPLAWVPLLIAAGPVAGAMSTRMTQRARVLWLASGLSRMQLFGEVERYGWGLMLIVMLFCLSLLVPQFALDVQDLRSARQLAIQAALPVACGAGFVYVGMAWVQGRLVAGSLIVAVSATLWLLDLYTMMSAAGLELPLLAAQVILVPVLRALARRQWQDIDWQRNRPARLPTRLA